MSTIYDWSKIPDEVKSIATDSDGQAYGFGCVARLGAIEGLWYPLCFIIEIPPHENPFQGDWRESLEQRPQHPCSGKCPRFDKEQCNSCLVGDE